MTMPPLDLPALDRMEARARTDALAEREGKDADGAK